MVSHIGLLLLLFSCFLLFCFFKQKTAYEMRISDWSSDVCSSDLEAKALGTKVVLVNPYLEPGMKRYWVPSTAKSAAFGTKIADYWFPVSQGGDIAFLYGALKVIFEKDRKSTRLNSSH